MTPRDRDTFVQKHATPARGQTSAPVEVHDETSQAHEDPDERKLWRSGQTHDKRLERLEGHVDTMRVGFAEFGGMLKVIVAGQEDSAAERKARREREEADAVRRAALWSAFIKIVVPTITAIGVIIAAVLAARGGK